MNRDHGFRVLFCLNCNKNLECDSLLLHTLTLLSSLSVLLMDEQTINWDFGKESGHTEMIDAAISKLTVRSIGRVPFTGPPTKNDGKPLEFLQIRPFYQDSDFTLLARKHDLYIVGFRNKFGLFEFLPRTRNTSDRLFSDSNFLPFQDAYKSIKNPLNKELDELVISYHTVLEAIIGLSRYNKYSDNQKELSMWLLTILIAVPESARFRKVYKLINRLVSSQTTEQKDCLVVFGELATLLTRWGRYSGQLILAHNKKELENMSPYQRNNVMILASRAKNELKLGVHTDVTLTKDQGVKPYTWGNMPLKQCDPSIFNMIQQENKLQQHHIELTASVNFSPFSVLQALGSPLTNKYSEGLPGNRFCGGNEFIDVIEEVCKNRALELFNLDSNIWSVNVQPYSINLANFAIFTAILEPNDSIMALGVPSGGCVSHGYCTKSNNVSAASIFFSSSFYEINRETGLIDYDLLEKDALAFKPVLIVCGGGAYPREWNYEKLKGIAKHCGALLLCDMAHVCGLVAAQEAQDPFQYCDMVSTPTNMTLRGPPSGMIFYRKDLKKLISRKPKDGVHHYENRINSSVSPSLQGGPHTNKIAAVAVALKLAKESNFKAYAKQMKANAIALGDRLRQKGYKLVTDGTDNDLVLLDLRPLSLTGDDVIYACGMCNILLKKTALVGDKKSRALSGILISTAAMTSRGLVDKDFEYIGDVLHQIVKVCQNSKQDRAFKTAPTLKILRRPVLGILRLKENEAQTQSTSA